MTDALADWDVSGKIQFPKIHHIAIRLSVLSVQSADVDRVCKAHKIIDTKSRNRLKNLTVQKLLFTYVNLRLLNGCSTELTEFLTQCIEAAEGDRLDDSNYDGKSIQRLRR